VANDERVKQIIVSDDSDPEYARRNREVVADYAGIQLFDGPRRGLAANRNHCLHRLDEAARAVAFLDDDASFREGFFHHAEVGFRRLGDRTILTGREYKNGTEVTPRNLSFWGHQEVRPTVMDDLHGICINAAVFPRQLFRLVEFDEELRYGSEEADITAQAEALGFKVVFDPALETDHRPSSTNRSEYSEHTHASRLYSTYKRYRWLERRPLKAMSFALLAPLHHVLASTRRDGIHGSLEAVRTVNEARSKVRRFSRARGTIVARQES
jgi:hypothetical protein